MTTGPAEFRQRTGVAVRAATLVDGGTLVVLTAAAATNVVCVVYDLSDSADAMTARLVGRLPGLLRGWPRETPVWAYALGDDAPLPGVAGGDVGHVLDGGLDLRSPFGDSHLLDDRRSRGSFLSPTLDAVARRAAAESVAVVHTVVVGDGRLTDFSPARVPPSLDVLGLVETDAAVGRAAAWRRVVGDAPVLAFDDRRLQTWFTDRRTDAATRPVLRVRCEDGPARVVAADETASPVSFDGVDWSPADGPLRLLLPPGAGGLVVTPLSAGHGLATAGGRTASTEQTAAVTLGRATLAAAQPVEADDLRRATRAASNSAGVASVDVVLDASATSEEFGPVWAAAVEAFARADAHRPWDAATSATLVPAAATPRAAVCLATRVPAGPPRPGDRVLVFAVGTAGLAWAAGDRLAVGTAAAALAVRYDAYEDRWHATAGDGVRVELHPAGPQRLADVVTADAVVWAAAFSGPLI